MDRNKIFNLLLGLLFSTFLVKILNFFKEIQISYFYGTGEIIDKYNIIMIAPSIALSTIAPAFGLILVSRYTNGQKLNIQKKEIIFFVASVVLLCVISLITNFQSGNSFDWLVSLGISILFLFQVILVYYLHCFNEFNKGSFSSMIQIMTNLIVVGFSIVFKSYYILLIGLFLGIILQLLYLVGVIKVKNYTPNIEIKTLKEESFFHSFFSVVLGYGLIEILVSAQKFFATYYNEEGLVSAINYSYKVMNLPISILLFAVLSVLFPVMTRTNEGKLQEITKGLLSGISFVMLPIAILFYFFAEFIISILFERGSFNIDSVIVTGRQLKGFALLLLPLSLYSSLLRVVFVKKEWSYIYKSGVIILTSIILFNLISLYIQDVTLFTFTIPIAFYLGITISFWKVIASSLDKDFYKSLLGSIVMILTIIVLSYTNSNHWISIALSLIIYIGSQLVLKNTLFKNLIGRVRS
ncbi:MULTISPECIES: lipid II flippase MurJ [Bhargavaea]|uniref:Lipid II flippase MurJ n=1 Tax=Bhargavaea changchunensis TaxID=2134037 RepID=A0ABW2NKE2_9BACL|nr:lipid II flippase MurJ [Bhargavaea sp. CC-171006]